MVRNLAARAIYPLEQAVDQLGVKLDTRRELGAYRMIGHQLRRSSGANDSRRPLFTRVQSGQLVPLLLHLLQVR